MFHKDLDRNGVLGEAHGRVLVSLGYIDRQRMQLAINKKN